MNDSPRLSHSESPLLMDEGMGQVEKSSVKTQAQNPSLETYEA
ncbi:uncharacterized protein VTP21DRAFT_11307 [Calcarisporiella thermophila]